MHVCTRVTAHPYAQICRAREQRIQIDLLCSPQPLPRTLRPPRAAANCSDETRGGAAARLRVRCVFGEVAQRVGGGDVGDEPPGAMPELQRRVERGEKIRHVVGVPACFQKIHFLVA